MTTAFLISRIQRVPPIVRLGLYGSSFAGGWIAKSKLDTYLTKRGFEDIVKKIKSPEEIEEAWEIYLIKQKQSDLDKEALKKYKWDP